MNDLRHTLNDLPDGDVIELDDLSWVAVPRIDRLQPFLVSVVSPSDHWLYLSTGGGLTAGRVDPESCLFPYVTDDQLHRGGQGGSITTIRLVRGGESVRWRPFRDELGAAGRRDLLKSVAGDRVRLIERRDDLGATCLVEWAFSEARGVVRRIRIACDEPTRVHLLDGIEGIVPAGALLAHMQATSCLIDAYRRSERVRDDLAVFTLEALLSDRAEPAESLRATTACAVGYGTAKTWLSRNAMAAFEAGEPINERSPWTGEVGCFLVEAAWDLAAGEARDAFVVADVQRTQHDVVGLRDDLEAGRLTPESLERDLAATSDALDRILLSVDGLQHTGDGKADAHHRSNALFNAMRGGVFADGHGIPVDDLASFVAQRNRRCAERQRAWFATNAGTTLEASAARAASRASGDADFERLVLEYLPIWFGRRHGDPSRPWNRFAIRVKHDDGSRRLTYQGNWRDIFQNWEALLATHPAFIEHVVARFVNATTLDGFNPYRITREGIDWEEPEPDNPWSNIGYWGDHQIPYLTRLLMLARELRGGALTSWLNEPRFSSADVPYVLAPIEERIADPRHTITFDEARHAAAMARVEAIGADGRLVPAGDEPLLLGLGEKLLVPVLCKLAHLVPGGGVWMNTQRPEWNDANNALAGFGLSMVTVCQLRRHLTVLRAIYRTTPEVVLTPVVTSWVRATTEALAGSELKDARDDAAARRRAVERLGRLYDDHAAAPRTGAPAPLPSTEIIALLDRAVEVLDDTIAANRRPDGLLHSYNLVHFGDGTAVVSHLDEMLEGQVAWLASGALSAEAAANLLDALFASRLHRDDIGTFLLYPDNPLPSFLERNRVPEGQGVGQLDALAADGDQRLAWRDADGVLRFAPELSNDRELRARLDEVGQDVPAIAAAREHIRARYEETFHHHAFTGRSGTMYGYEGLGCTYWHMVGKLLVATLECHEEAMAAHANTQVVARLASAYERVRDGLGARMKASTFGAVPTDAYSHTPAHRGAQQPGMTGLVKEELVARRGELGVRVIDGCLVFDPRLIDPAEWSTEASTWALPDGRSVEVPERALAFLFAGVPTVYRRDASEVGVRVLRFDGTTSHHGGRAGLTRGETDAVLRRDGTIARILVDCRFGLSR